MSTHNIKGLSFERPKRKQTNQSFASSRAKIISSVQNHTKEQFNYEGTAHPRQHATFYHDIDDSSTLDEQDRNFCHFEHTPDRGRVLIADMNFQPGDVIFREKPLLSASWEELSCFQCGQAHPSETCRSFLGLFGDSPLSKGVMSLEDTLTGYEVIGDLDRARLFIKLLWLRRLCPDAQCWRELAQLTVSGTQTEACIACINEFRNKTLVQQSKLILPSDKTSDLAHLLAILNNNSHEIPEFGSGIWLYASLLEHSCHPNCNFVTTQNELLLIALSHIPCGASLTIDYNVHTYQPQAVRQQGTLSHYGFACTCVPCTTGFDTPRAFFCPQAIRYHAQSTAQQQIQQQQPVSPSFAFGDNAGDIVQRYKREQAKHFELTSTYAFDSLHISRHALFLHTAPNPDCPSFSDHPCVNGLVHPIGDGINPSPQINTKWKCSGCGYVLTPQEVTLCLQAEQEIQAPSSDMLQADGGNDANDLQEMFSRASYSLPCLAQVNAWLQAGIVHFSHSKMYWILYANGLIWTDRATSECYSHELSQSSSHKKKPAGKKKKIKTKQKKSVKSTSGSTASADPATSMMLNQLGSSVTTLTLQTEPNMSSVQPAFQVPEAPEQHESALTRRDISTLNDILHIWSPHFVSPHQQQRQDMQAADSSSPAAWETYPLIAEHCWLLTIDALSHTLHLLHPELLILCDYLAQIQILKQRTFKAKLIWIYCYHISIIINSCFSLETNKLYQLVTHTPTSIMSLQLHYQRFQKLMDQCQFQNDTETIRILEQYSNNALDYIDSEASRDNNALMHGISSALYAASGSTQPQQFDDDDDDDDDNARYRMISPQQQHNKMHSRRYNYQHLQALHQQGVAASASMHDDEPKKRSKKAASSTKSISHDAAEATLLLADLKFDHQNDLSAASTFRNQSDDEDESSIFSVNQHGDQSDSGDDNRDGDNDDDDDDDDSSLNALYNSAFAQRIIKNTSLQQKKQQSQVDASSAASSATAPNSSFGQFVTPKSRSTTQEPPQVFLPNAFGFAPSALFSQSGTTPRYSSDMFGSSSNPSQQTTSDVQTNPFVAAFGVSSFGTQQHQQSSTQSNTTTHSFRDTEQDDF